MFTKIISNSEVPQKGIESLEKYVNYLGDTLQQLPEIIASLAQIKKELREKDHTVEIQSSVVEDIIDCSELVNIINNKVVEELKNIFNDISLAELEKMEIMDLFVFVKDGVLKRFDNSEDGKNARYDFRQDILNFIDKNKLRDENFHVWEFNDSSFLQRLLLQKIHCSGASLHLYPYSDMQNNNTGTIGDFLRKIDNPNSKEKTLKVFQYLFERSKAHKTLSHGFKGKLLPEFDTETMNMLAKVKAKLADILEQVNAIYLG